MANLFGTFSDIVQNVLVEAGLVSGTGVQTYSEPQAEVAVQRIFDLLIGARNWAHITTWDTFTLDGATGVVTGDLSDIRDFTHIKEIRRVENNALVVKPQADEHLRVTGSVAQYWTPLNWTASNFDTKKIKFWPITATGTLNIQFRTVPEAFTNDSVVPLPQAIIETGAAWYLLRGDGINPENADKAQETFTKLYNNYLADIGEGAIGNMTTALTDAFTIGTTL